MRGTIVARGGSPLRKTPKTGRVVRKLARHSSVEILGQETWVRVRTRDGRVGYVLADLVEVAPEDLFPSAEASSKRARGAAAPPPRQARPRRRGVRVASVTSAAAASPAVPQLFQPCDIRIYRNTRFVGAELRADAEFFPSLDLLNEIAAACNVDIFITSSTREPDRKVEGAIVKPATRSNHLVGHAIDMNLRLDTAHFNSKALRRSNLKNLPREVRDFIDRIRASGSLRWGGDFSAEDPVHIDDHLNRDAVLWDRKLESRI